MAALAEPRWPDWSAPKLVREQLWSADDAAWHAGLQEKYESWRGHLEGVAAQAADRDQEDGEHDHVAAAPASGIPRILHQIWLGPKPVPEAFVARWKALHPAWEYRLWRDADVAALGLANARAFGEATNWGEASDVARYEILLRFGGVYADMDFEPLRPLDALCASAEFFVGFSNVGAVEINNGVVGAAPGHALAEALVERVGGARRAAARRTKPPPTALLAALGASGFLDAADAAPLARTLRQADLDWTIEHTGPGLMTRTFCELHGAHATAVCLPYEVFYARPNDADKAAAPPPPSALAVHHWARSWQEPC